MKYVLIVTTAVFIAFGSIAWNAAALKGNGDVIKKKRDIKESFHSVEVCQGIDLFIKQGNDISVTVETDENIYNLLVTEVKNDVLHVYFSDNVRNVKCKKVYVTLKELQSVKTSSGADVLSETKISGNSLKLRSSSGSDIKLELDYKTVTASSSSGSDIELSGSCDELTVSSSSGSDINAKDLIAKKVTAESSSGSDISVHAETVFEANASSGSDIICTGKPEEKNISRSSGGSVKLKN